MGVLNQTGTPFCQLPQCKVQLMCGWLGGQQVQQLRVDVFVQIGGWSAHAANHASMRVFSVSQIAGAPRWTFAPTRASTWSRVTL